MKVFLAWLAMAVALPFLIVWDALNVIWDWITFPIREYKDGE